jgi:methionyl-tRNA formyltransferase
MTPSPACVTKLRTVFFGTPAFACPSLRALAAACGCEIAAVVTQPDRPSGRELRVTASPVKRLALELGIPLVLQPERARAAEFIQRLAGLRPELAVVAAYGQILPPELLALPRFGCLNVHASLLPKFRGAAPIQWALIEDERDTGITIMLMDAGLDTGPIVSARRTEILASDDAQSLHDRLAEIGAALLIDTLPAFVAGGLKPEAQPGTGATYARKLRRADAQIDWRLTARGVWSRTRGCTPWPGAFTLWPVAGRERVLKIWSSEPAPGCGAAGAILRAGGGELLVACGEGALRILRLQPEGGRVMEAADFLTGHALQPGVAFVSAAEG